MTHRPAFRLLPTLLGALLALAAASSNAANALSLADAQADTTITQHPSLGGGTAPQGHEDSLWDIVPAGYEAHTLVRFDLSAWAGQTVHGNAQMDLGFIGMPFSPTVDITIRPVGEAWGEYTATWTNFGFNLGAPVGGGTVTGADYAEGDRVAFSLPNALVQQWIDNPASNHGVMLQASNGRDLYFASREYTPVGGMAGEWAPQISFVSTAAAVPEAQTWALMGLGLAALAGLSRRRRSA